MRSVILSNKRIWMMNEWLSTCMYLSLYLWYLTGYKRRQAPRNSCWRHQDGGEPRDTGHVVRWRNQSTLTRHCSRYLPDTHRVHTRYNISQQLLRDVGQKLFDVPTNGNVRWVWIPTVYDTIEEFDVDWKPECGQLNLAHVARNKKIHERRRNKTNKRQCAASNSGTGAVIRSQTDNALSCSPNFQE